MNVYLQTTCFFSLLALPNPNRAARKSDIGMEDTSAEASRSVRRNYSASALFHCSTLVHPDTATGHSRTLPGFGGIMESTGIDIVASSHQRDFLIDVKRYRATVPVTVELVRAVYGVAASTSPSRPGRILHGGIITSSKFTKDAEIFKQTVRPRPLLRDGEWLRTELGRFAPRMRR
jgi:hypothetical protein